MRPDNSISVGWTGQCNQYTDRPQPYRVATDGYASTDVLQYLYKTQTRQKLKKLCEHVFSCNMNPLIALLLKDFDSMSIDRHIGWPSIVQPWHKEQFRDKLFAQCTPFK